MDQKEIRAFKIIHSEELPDIHSTGYILRHNKTGARVMCIENGDENKVFNIAFRTPPRDSTGVAHILEHSVLCGSRNFPLKDPFVELVKGSLNTFLNAMTFPDKTCYPVASCNDKDFQNLMHVYLDAVFYPRIYDREEIFRQEGWSYHLEDAQGPLTYNGVVYNEMKGAFSSPDDVLEREIMNHLFPDTPYGVESGGHPEHIPELTYEAFLDFHRTYYHPSNSYIYLYGNMDMAEKLDFIDREYLSAFDPLEVHSEIPLQEPFPSVREAVLEYPVAENEAEENNSYLSYNVVIGKEEDTKLSMAFEILDYALLSAPGAPLKKTLVEAGIGSDVYGSFEDGILQPYFSVNSKGANASQKEDFVSLIRRVLEKQVRDGIDEKALLAGINYYEFRYREADFSSYPKGLIYGLDLITDWIYSDEDPFAQVRQLGVFEQLKEAVGSGYYEELIRHYLLDNPHGCVITLVPRRGLAAKRDQELAEALEKYRASLTADEIEDLLERTRNLAAYQEEPEDPDAVRRIPMLARGDIGKEAKKFTTREEEVDGSTLLYHEVDTNGIGYLDVMFRLHDFTPEKIHLYGILKSVLGYVDTDRHTYGDLFNEINAATGGLSAGVECYDDALDPEKFTALFGIKGKCLYESFEFLFEMIDEILSVSHLEDTRRLAEIVAEVRSRAQASLVSGGHATAVLRGTAYLSGRAAFQDELSGIGFYQFIEALDKDFENRGKALASSLRETAREIFCRENLIVSYAGEPGSLEAVRERISWLSRRLSDDVKSLSVPAKAYSFANEGFRTAGQVQYVARCGNFVTKGLSYTGTLEILKVILGYDYLWMNIRVQGGAYGCMNGFRRNGESFFVSYRDPHLERTLKVFEGIPEYIRGFEADEREMTKYIIGTISNKDVPRTPQMQGSISRAAWFSGVTDEMVQKERDQILNARSEDIRALAEFVEAILSDRRICVVGSERVLGQAEGILDEVKPLFQM